MSDQAFIEWREEFEETLLCEYGIGIDDTGLTDADMTAMMDTPAYQVAHRYAEKRNLTSKNQGY